MNPTPSPVSTRNRQMIYGVIIVVLFAVMYPYRLLIEELKARKELGEATLGQIDTSSFVLKLLMIGGFRGMAANILWNQAIDLQKVHEWDRLKQKVDMITKLQPHFLSIWTFQGWNLAYNVSVEWDAPEDKYEWIKNGIVFLRDGVAKNQKSPDLIWDTAWTYYHKLGFADEAIILRRLFRDDDDEPFKTDPEDNVVKHDNFQLAHGWFSRAVDLVQQGEKRLAQGAEKDIEYVDKPNQRKGRPGDLSFRSMPAHAQTRYAQRLEIMSMKGVPATFGEVARNEWYKAYQEWVEFGHVPFASFSKPDEMVYLDDATNIERFKKLSDDQKYWTVRWGNQLNYPYWKDRASAEMEPDGVKARQLFYEGLLALKSADFLAAVDHYSKGLKVWEDLLKRHNDYRNDDLNQRDTGLVLKRYLQALRQAGLEPPKEMPFPELMKYIQGDFNPDPFDAVEMIRSSSAKPDLGTQPPAPPQPGSSPRR
jgi:hypothetical protein